MRKCHSPIRHCPVGCPGLVGVRLRAGRTGARPADDRGGCRSTRRCSWRSSRTSASGSSGSIRRSRTSPIAQARSAWVPTLLDQPRTRRRPQPADQRRSPAARTKITDRRFETPARRHADCCRPAATTRSPGTARGISTSNFFTELQSAAASRASAFNVTPAAAPQLQDRQHAAAARDQPQGSARTPTRRCSRRSRRPRAT